MRIITWNCRRGPLEKKLEPLRALAPDIAVITETPRPKTARKHERWFGEGSLGVLVIGSPACEIEPVSVGTGCVHHVKVSGARNFDLLAVWTWSKPSYLGTFRAGLQRYRKSANASDVVIAGDLNGGPKFDRERVRKSWADEFADLKARGLVSSYHHLRKEAYAEETRNTHWHQGKETPGFHIDYVFVPESWIGDSAKVTIGGFKEWSTISDHAPVIVDL